MVGENVRMLVDEGRGVVDFVVDDKIEVFLGVVLFHLVEAK